MQNQVDPKVGLVGDLKELFSARNWSAIKGIVDGFILKKELDVCSLQRLIAQMLTRLQSQSAANIAGNLPDYSTIRQAIINGQVKTKYDKMLHRKSPGPHIIPGGAAEIRTFMQTGRCTNPEQLP